MECELARRARDGDREALAELVEQERLSLFTLAYAQLRHYDDAQDAVGAALLQICLHIRELREPEHVRAWMQTIVRNQVRMRRRRSLPEAGGMSLEDCAAAAAELAETNPTGSCLPDLLLRLDVLHALRRLPWDEARAIALYYLALLPVREIAQPGAHEVGGGRPEGTIKRWLHLGRQQLATELVAYAPGGSPGCSAKAREKDEIYATGYIQ